MNSNRTVETGWVKAPLHITGLDHLGVQAPCIETYSQLLPGITNVTDRARYYSFYAWIFYAFEIKGWKDDETFLKMFRRADCLFSLIAIVHGEDTDNSSIHSGAVVGKDTLQNYIAELKEGKLLRLSQFSHQEPTTSRYFKNPYGGLGQYYFGTLRGLHILKGDSPRQGQLVREVGLKLAQAFHSNVEQDLFLTTIENDIVEYEILRKLNSFCPCNLSRDTEERKLLIQLFTQGFESLYQKEYKVDVEAVNRTSSMAYILRLASYAHTCEVNFNVNTFRKLAYSKTLYNLDDSNKLCMIESKWQVYSRNELASIAMQGLFHCVLKAIENEAEKLKFLDTKSASTWFWEQGPGGQVIETYKGESLGHMMKMLSKKLANFNDWQSSKHEMSLANIIEHETRREQTDSSEIILCCLKILASLGCRQENQSGYDQIQFPPNYLERYPLNLTTILRSLNEELNRLNCDSALSLITQRYLLNNHFNVALRKLRNQGQMTFRFVSGELGIEVIKAPPAVFTSPRFKQTLQIMEDFGLISNNNSEISINQSGYDFIEAVI
ncbi:hypothetical protein KW505_04465 [Vibrio fluvialis]|nr:hypothetical protein [Vibrio fluvialis]MBY8178959.1 hypothetical protein [Vibrio fluvialis]